jgi:serine-type D-Ala-D-Ala carboxypeptidase (penicillin-binding protein 5/6)
MHLDCTHFASASGIVDRGNYSCTTDLAVLAHSVLEQPLLARIVGARFAILPFPIKGGHLFLWNNNPLLIMRYPGADGVKTGYTSASGPCLVAAARRGHTWLGVVLLHSVNPAGQAIKLFNLGFARLGTR